MTKKQLMRMKKEDLVMLLCDNENALVTTPKDIYLRCLPYAKEDREFVISVILDGAHHIVDVHVTTIGIANRSLVHPREVYRDAIKENAVAIALVHNHPSGNLTPSEDDKDATRRIIKAGEILGIKCIDSIIIGPGGYYSFLENGILGD